MHYKRFQVRGAGGKNARQSGTKAASSPSKKEIEVILERRDAERRARRLLRFIYTGLGTLRPAEIQTVCKGWTLFSDKSAAHPDTLKAEQAKFLGKLVGVAEGKSKSGAGIGNDKRSRKQTRLGGPVQRNPVRKRSEVLRVAMAELIPIAKLLKFCGTEACGQAFVRARERRQYSAGCRTPVAKTP